MFPFNISFFNIVIVIGNTEYKLLNIGILQSIKLLFSACDILYAQTTKLVR